MGTFESNFRVVEAFCHYATDWEWLDSRGILEKALIFEENSIPGTEDQAFLDAIIAYAEALEEQEINPCSSVDRATIS